MVSPRPGARRTWLAFEGRNSQFEQAEALAKGICLSAGGLFSTKMIGRGDAESSAVVAVPE